MQLFLQFYFEALRVFAPGLKICMRFGHYRHMFYFFFQLVNLVIFGISDAMSGYLVNVTPLIILFQYF